ncbi:MAG: ABC transporter substrate-binding protein [Planctomycetes bacterium]|nr:ABC transporter substrate-binding protein [Planctomycetota bacterium]MBI3848176.1 ABC transporter substrate-binding protein [Planctomycetota bacterium]
MRIVSLLPSLTEVVCALGGRDDLVGRSHECDFPAGLDTVPVLTAAKIRVDGSAAEIQAAVQAMSGQAIYRVDEAKLAALRPDVVLTQDQCEVCAVSVDDVKRALQLGGLAASTRIVVVKPARLDDVIDDVARVGEAIGRADAGRRVADEMRERIEKLNRYATERRGPRPAPRLLLLEWTAPPMVAGTWLPDLVMAAGAEHPWGAPGDASRAVALSDLAEPAPDVVVAAPCGLALDRAATELERMLASRDCPARLRGVPCYAADGNALFNRPGPRLVDSVAALVGITCGDAPGFPDWRSYVRRVPLGNGR